MVLTATKWRASLAGLPERLGDLDRNAAEGGLKQAVVEVWRVISTAPSGVLQLYEQSTEERITSISDATPIDLTDPCFGMPKFDGTDETGTLALLGGFLRSLENELFEFDLADAPVDPNVDWRVEVGGEAFLLIPIAKRAWRETKDPKLDRRPFVQRGLARSRIVPLEVDAAQIKVTWLEFVPRWSGPSVFGAALFDAIDFDEDKDDATFLVTAVSGSDMEGMARKAVEDAHSHDCLALVFPELTIDDVLLDAIGDDLAKKPWSAKGRRVPSIVVAGSWHRERGDGFANVSVVLDGYGETVLEHHKRFVFKGPNGLSERISPGRILDLLITQDGIFTFGICLDFCHMSYDTSYGELGADFVLVPSCGNGATMQGHVAQAYKLMIGSKTRCFVVQQAYPNLPDKELPPGKGFVLNPSSNVEQPSVVTLVSTQNCSFFTADPFQ